MRTTTDDGAVEHTVTPHDNSEYDRIVITHTIDDPARFTVQCYTDGGVDESFAVETRNMSFDPVSLLGRGETDRLQGVSITDNSGSDPVTERANIPEDVKIAFESLGFTIVPRGRGWLDL